MLHLAICDDDKALLDALRLEVENWAAQEKEACSVEVYASAEAFLFAWDERKDTDVLLLDIEMPGMNGIELTRKLRREGEHIGIILVTGNPDFALEGYDLEVASYLVKPVKLPRLYAALQRARERARERKAILAPLSAGEVERVYVADICYLESDGHDTILWKRDGGRLDCKAGLLQMERELAGEDGAFFKPHRSYLVNLECVERIGKKDVRMADGTSVPIARGKWEELNWAYMKYYRRRQFY